MSGVRDPAFWKRFSTAIHLDEEGVYGRPELKHSDSWLGKQRRKQQRRRYVCLIFWICFLAFIAGVVAVVIWLLKSGILNKVHLGNGDGTPNQPANPNGGKMGDTTTRRVRRVVEEMVKRGAR